MEIEDNGLSYEESLGVTSARSIQRYTKKVLNNICKQKGISEYSHSLLCSEIDQVFDKLIDKLVEVNVHANPKFN